MIGGVRQQIANGSPLKRKQQNPRDNVFETHYPNIARWVKQYGWIEIGCADYRHSFIRVLDDGGLIWESQKKYKTVDEALQALETELTQWMRQQGFIR